MLVVEPASHDSFALTRVDRFAIPLVMNELRSRSRRNTTQAAEGLPRWRWTLAEFDRFIELGILFEDDRVELIGGELVPMAAKGIAHA